MKCFLVSQSMNLSPAGCPPGTFMPSMLRSSSRFSSGDSNSIAAVAYVPLLCVSDPTATRETAPAVVNIERTDCYERRGRGSRMSTVGHVTG